MLIDTHCHLHDLEWFTPEQQEDFLTEAYNDGVEKVICIGTDPEDSLKAQAFAAAHENVYWTYGIHPEFANTAGDMAGETALLFERLKRAKAERAEGAPRKDGRASGSRAKECGLACLLPVAIGEIGLDYHYDHNRAHQIKLFEEMLQLATSQNLPVSLHIREAFADAWGVLDNFPKVQGVVHSFTGSKRDLRVALERGFYIGVNGLATYTTTPLPPLERILLETDAPFLTPVPFRGTINSPRYIKVIAAYLAQQLGVAETLIAEQTTQNARQIFKV